MKIHHKHDKIVGKKKTKIRGKADKKMNTDVKELEVMEDIASLAAVTGEKKEKYLFWQLEISMAHAKRIDLIVSFLMESGVKMLLPQLKQAQKKRRSKSAF